MWRKSFNPLRRVLSACVAVIFMVSGGVFPGSVNAQMTLNLPAAGTMVGLSSTHTPAIITGITINPDNPLELDFIVDTGDDFLEGEALSQEASKMINYFFAALTVPENEMWVNLSPYEENRIMADGLSQTEMGRDMLAQDYLLKQITASLMYPEEELGETFWNRVQEKVEAKYGKVEIPTNTFNKVWIVPQEAQIYVYGNNVFVAKNYLNVMLEQDYVALDENKNSIHHGVGDAKLQPLTSEAAQAVREVLIPEIEREVNEGKNFAPLRQIFNSVILAAWYKKKLKQSILNEMYLDKNKMSGIDLAEEGVKEKIYNQYVEAFTKGAFDYIKEDYDPVAQDVVSKKYFSGGVMANPSFAMAETLPSSFVDRAVVRSLVAQPAAVSFAVRADVVGEDGEVVSSQTSSAAMSSESSDKVARVYFSIRPTEPVAVDKFVRDALGEEEFKKRFKWNEEKQAWEAKEDIEIVTIDEEALKAVPLKIEPDRSVTYSRVELPEPSRSVLPVYLEDRHSDMRVEPILESAEFSLIREEKWTAEELLLDERKESRRLRPIVIFLLAVMVAIGIFSVITEDGKESEGVVDGRPDQEEKQEEEQEEDDDLFEKLKELALVEVEDENILQEVLDMLAQREKDKQKEEDEEKLKKLFEKLKELAKVDEDEENKLRKVVLPFDEEGFMRLGSIYDPDRGKILAEVLDLMAQELERRKQNKEREKREKEKKLTDEELKERIKKSSYRYEPGKKPGQDKSEPSDKEEITDFINPPTSLRIVSGETLDGNGDIGAVDGVSRVPWKVVSGGHYIKPGDLMTVFGVFNKLGPNGTVVRDENVFNQDIPTLDDGRSITVRFRLPKDIQANDSFEMPALFGDTRWAPAGFKAPDSDNNIDPGDFKLQGVNLVAQQDTNGGLVDLILKPVAENGRIVDYSNVDNDSVALRAEWIEQERSPSLGDVRELIDTATGSAELMIDGVSKLASDTMAYEDGYHIQFNGLGQATKSYSDAREKGEIYLGECDTCSLVVFPMFRAADVPVTFIAGYAYSGGRWHGHAELAVATKDGGEVSYDITEHMGQNPNRVNKLVLIPGLDQLFESETIAKQEFIVGGGPLAISQFGTLQELETFIFGEGNKGPEGWAELKGIDANGSAIYEARVHIHSVYATANRTRQDIADAIGVSIEDIDRWNPRQNIEGGLEQVNLYLTDSLSIQKALGLTNSDRAMAAKSNDKVYAAILFVSFFAIVVFGFVLPFMDSSDSSDVDKKEGEDIESVEGAEGVEGSGDSRTVQELIHTIYELKAKRKTGDEQYKSANEVLMKRGKKALSGLVEAMEDPFNNVGEQRLAAEYIVNIGATSERDPKTGQYVQRSPSPAKPYVSNLVEFYSNNPDLRQDGMEEIEIIQNLGKLGYGAEDAIDMLIEYLSDSNQNIQLEAMRALRKIGTYKRKTFKRLMVLAKDSDQELASSAASTLATFAQIYQSRYEPEQGDYNPILSTLAEGYLELIEAYQNGEITNERVRSRAFDGIRVIPRHSKRSKEVLLSLLRSKVYEANTFVVLSSLAKDDPTILDDLVKAYNSTSLEGVWQRWWLNRLLVDGHGDVKLLPNGVTAFWLWAENYSVKDYMQLNPNLNAKDNNGTAVLHRLAKYDKMRINLRLFLENGADVNIRDAEQNTPLMIAVRHENLEAVKLLLRHKADSTLKNGKGETVLDIVKAEHREGLVQLIEAAAEENQAMTPDAAMIENYTVETLAIDPGLLEALQIQNRILKHNEDADVVGDGLQEIISKLLSKEKLSDSKSVRRAAQTLVDVFKDEFVRVTAMQLLYDNDFSFNIREKQLGVILITLGRYTDKDLRVRRFLEALRYSTGTSPEVAALDLQDEELDEGELFLLSILEPNAAKQIKKAHKESRKHLWTTAWGLEEVLPAGFIILLDRILRRRIKMATTVVEDAVNFVESRGSDEAMNPGGIDLNPNMLDLSGEDDGLNFSIDPAMLQGLDPSEVFGLKPVIINVTPMPSVLPLLGLADDLPQQQQLTKIDSDLADDALSPGRIVSRFC